MENLDSFRIIKLLDSLNVSSVYSLNLATHIHLSRIATMDVENGHEHKWLVSGIAFTTSVFIGFC